jgi:hypothetical protein
VKWKSNPSNATCTRASVPVALFRLFNNSEEDISFRSKRRAELRRNKENWFPSRASLLLATRDRIGKKRREIPRSADSVRNDDKGRRKRIKKEDQKQVCIGGRYFEWSKC